MSGNDNEDSDVDDDLDVVSNTADSCVASPSDDSTSQRMPDSPGGHSSTNDIECSRPKIAREGQQSPTKSLNSPPISPPQTSSTVSSLKKHSPPNVTVIHPSANHPMFSYLCHATGNMAAMAAGYMTQPNYPAGFFPSMELTPNAAAAASLMNPFLFSQLLRQGFPPAVSVMEGNSPMNTGGIYSRSPVSLPHRFNPYQLPMTSSALPQVSAAASLLSRNSVVNSGDELKNLLNTLSRIKGEV